MATCFPGPAQGFREDPDQEGDTGQYGDRRDVAPEAGMVCRWQDWPEETIAQSPRHDVEAQAACQGCYLNQSRGGHGLRPPPP